MALADCFVSLERNMSFINKWRKELLMRNNVFVWALVILMAAAGTSQGVHHFDGGIGYVRLSLDGDSNDEFDGWGPAFRYWFSDPMDSDGLMPFLGLHSSSYPGDMNDDPIWDIWILAPEAGLAWHKSLGDSGLFIEPGVTVGAAIAKYERRGDSYVSFNVGEDDMAVGWALRPGILLGYQRDTWSIGVEASYGILDIDFSDEVRFVFDGDLYSSREVKGTHEELYIGLFGRFFW
jgi:hypothetical protein